MTAELPDASDKKSKMNVCCSIHLDEECSFVCGDCTELICDYCVGTKSHEDHDIKSIKKFIKEIDLDDFKESCKNIAQVLDKTEKRFQKVIDGIHSQTSKMISEIIKIKKKKIRKCEERKEKNATTVNEFLAAVDPTKIIDIIDNLPKKGGRTQYEEVAQALLKCHKTVESEDFETNFNASVYVPTFTRRRIQNSRLEKQFGKLNFDDESTESESSDDESESCDDESESSDDESESSDDESKCSDDESESNDNESESSDHESEISDD